MDGNHHPKMRIMLSQSSSGLKVASGGFKSNFHLISAIHAMGHSTRIISQFRKEELEKEGIEFKTRKRVLLEGRYQVESYSFRYKGIKMVGCEVGIIGHPLEGDDNDDFERGEWLKGTEDPDKFLALQEYVLQEVEEFRPTHFISNESTSLKLSFGFPVIRVFIIHAAEHLPFGPYNAAKGFGSYGSEAETQRLHVHFFKHSSNYLLFRIVRVDILLLLSIHSSQISSFLSLKPLRTMLGIGES